MGLQQGSLVPARAVADGTAAVARMVLPRRPISLIGAWSVLSREGVGVELPPLRSRIWAADADGRERVRYFRTLMLRLRETLLPAESLAVTLTDAVTRRPR